jgi:hypothetical protein
VKIAYEERRFQQRSLVEILQAAAICEEYLVQGLPLTLRQLHYQLVARGLRENTKREYDRLSERMTDARNAGWIDWNAIVDRTRTVREESHWSSPQEIITECVDAYHIDRWANQPFRVEVWTEKDAAISALELVCPVEDVAYSSARGFGSTTLVWQAARRVADYIDNWQGVVVLYLGDHDPSGASMMTDLPDRIRFYLGSRRCEMFLFEVIALTQYQVEEYDPPPQYAKPGDTRTAAYIEKQGDDRCWELDALSPTIIADVIRRTIEVYRDADLWAEAIKEEDEGKRQLSAMTDTRLLMPEPEVGS